MRKFEIYEENVIYTNGRLGAILVPSMGYWHPFQFFDNGNCDIYDNEHYDTPAGAASRAEEIFT